MRNSVKANELVTRLIPVIFSGIGFLFLMVSLIIFLESQSFKKSAVHTTAVIVGFQHTGDTDTGSRTIVEFTDTKQKTHRAALSFFSSTFREGDSLSVYYHSDDPTIARAEGQFVVLLSVFGGLGGLFFTIGAVILLVSLRRRLQKKRLLENGRMVDASIVEVAVNLHIRVNRSHPYYILCQWRDPSTGISYCFKSENLWFDPEPLLTALNLTALPVYIDETNPRKHYADTEKLKQAHGQMKY